MLFVMSTGDTVKQVLIFALSLFISVSCGTKSQKRTPAEEAPRVAGTLYTTLLFEEGKADLGSENKQLLREIAARAHRSKKTIDEILILAWADKEYPDKVRGKASTKDIILASERAQEVRNYLENDLKENENIDSFNMAKRPGLFSKLVRNQEYEVKKAFDLSGATASKLPDGSVSFTKSSKAIVIIDFEGNEDNLK
jgi:hypothetical protein